MLAIRRVLFGAKVQALGSTLRFTSKYRRVYTLARDFILPTTVLSLAAKK